MASAKIVSRKNEMFSNNTFSDINEILDTFANISKTDEANSVISKAFNKIVKHHPEIGSSYINNFYSAVFNSITGQTNTSNLSIVQTNKNARIQEYERMARNAEVDACLDEIADAAINFNEKRQCVEIVFNDIDYIGEGAEGEAEQEAIEQKQDILYKEFYKFIYPLKLKNKLHRYVKTFLKTGECCWENVIDPENPLLGIIDFQFLPSHSYDFAYDKETHEKVGIWVRVLSTRPGSTLNYDINSGNIPGISNSNYASYLGNNYQLAALNRYSDYSSGDLMFLPFEQITYVESGEHSPDDLIVYPLIEKARRAFNQLMCVEDAIIIYRLARAPTRLVFNVGVGMANNSKGAQQVQQLIRRYNVAKTYNPQTGTMTNTRDPHTMTESFWFMKSANGEGTDVSELSSNIDMGDLPDLQYFQKKLWAAMHVPAKRFTDGGEMLNKNPANEMTADEYKFCKFIIRILLNFSDAIKESFLTHLELTGLKEKLNIDESFFDIHFVNPLSYELYEQSRILMQRIEMYKAITEDGETFSKTIAMKKYLNFTNDEVEENWIELEKEKIRTLLIEAKAEAVVEDEMESFKERLAAERAVKNQEEDTDKTYDSTEDVIDDATTVKKSDQVIQNGVEQMAAQAQQAQASQVQSFDAQAAQQQEHPIQEPQSQVPEVSPQPEQQQKLSDLD
jgi:hypothetical protein